MSDRKRITIHLEDHGDPSTHDVRYRQLLRRAWRPFGFRDLGVLPEITPAMIQAALLRVADSVARHLIGGEGFSPTDRCFQVDLRRSEQEILDLINARLSQKEGQEQ